MPSDIIARLTAATEPSRELDAEDMEQINRDYALWTRSPALYFWVQQRRTALRARGVG